MHNDASSDDFEAQRQDVQQILSDLGIEYESDKRIIEAYNKIDKITDHSRLMGANNAGDHTVGISAVTKQGVETLLQNITKILSASHIITWFFIPHSDGKSLSWLYENAEMLKRESKQDYVHCQVRIDQANIDRFESLYGYKKME